MQCAAFSSDFLKNIFCFTCTYVLSMIQNIELVQVKLTSQLYCISWVYTGKSLSEPPNMLRTCCVQRLFWMSKQKTWNCKLRTCCEQKLFFVFVLIFRTIFVHNMFPTCCELLTKIYLYPARKGRGKVAWI